MKALQSLERTSAREAVVAALSRAVSGGEIPVGEFLPAERMLAARLGVSRVVVREAAKTLEEQGLVRIRHGIGVEVVDNPAFPVEKTIRRLLPGERERLRQCAQARLLIEPELAALAAGMGVAAGRRIRAAHQAMERAVGLAAAIEADIAFHERIAEAAGNRVLALMLRSVVTLGRESRVVTFNTVGIAKALRHHGEVLRAILARDAGEARTAMRAHLQSALSDLDLTEL